MIDTMIRVSEASSWFVVPNSGQIVRPPEPSMPWLNTRAMHSASVTIVPTMLFILKPMTSEASWNTKRSRRTPVSIVVAANSTAIVASTVADSDWGRPSPISMMLPPPSTKAFTPPLLNAA